MHQEFCCKTKFVFYITIFLCMKSLLGCLKEQHLFSQLTEKAYPKSWWQPRLRRCLGKWGILWLAPP